MDRTKVVRDYLEWSLERIEKLVEERKDQEKKMNAEMARIITDLDTCREETEKAEAIRDHLKAQIEELDQVW